MNEIQSMFNELIPSKITIVTPAQLEELPADVIEDGKTLEENAFKKAKEYSERYKLPCFADDTGLEIDALKGKPGVYSARFAGEPANDAENRKKVISLLSDEKISDYKAAFRTVICYYSSGKAVYLEGKCEGSIILEEKGSAGFGYDPIFVPKGFTKTFAEMTSEEKNAISHRRLATEQFIRLIIQLYSL